MPDETKAASATDKYITILRTTRRKVTMPATDHDQRIVADVMRSLDKRKAELEDALARFKAAIKERVVVVDSMHDDLGGLYDRAQSEKLVLCDVILDSRNGGMIKVIRKDNGELFGEPRALSKAEREAFDATKAQPSLLDGGPAVNEALAKSLKLSEYIESDPPVDPNERGRVALDSSALPDDLRDALLALESGDEDAGAALRDAKKADKKKAKAPTDDEPGPEKAEKDAAPPKPPTPPRKKVAMPPSTKVTFGNVDFGASKIVVEAPSPAQKGYRITVQCHCDTSGDGFFTSGASGIVNLCKQGLYQTLAVRIDDMLHTLSMKGDEPGIAADDTRPNVTIYTFTFTEQDFAILTPAPVAESAEIIVDAADASEGSDANLTDGMDEAEDNAAAETEDEDDEPVSVERVVEADDEPTAFADVAGSEDEAPESTSDTFVVDADNDPNADEAAADLADAIVDDNIADAAIVDEDDLPDFDAPNDEDDREPIAPTVEPTPAVSEPVAEPESTPAPVAAKPAESAPATAAEPKKKAKPKAVTAAAAEPVAIVKLGDASLTDTNHFGLSPKYRVLFVGAMTDIVRKAPIYASKALATVEADAKMKLVAKAQAAILPILEHLAETGKIARRVEGSDVVFSVDSTK